MPITEIARRRIELLVPHTIQEYSRDKFVQAILLAASLGTVGDHDWGEIPGQPENILLGLGTPGTIPVFNAEKGLGDSIITQQPGMINVGGNVTSNGYIVVGGTSQHFLKGDGSLDLNTYVTHNELEQIILDPAPPHNELDGLQGGDPENDEYYHITGYERELIGLIVAPNESRLLSGGLVIWTGTGFVYNVSEASYVIAGRHYSTPWVQRTLDPADAFDRIDLFAVDSNQNVLVIKGTPSSNPVKAQLTDPENQLELTTVLVRAGATEPEWIEQTIIYDENIEWAVQLSGPGTLDPNDTSNPFRGQKAVNVSSLTTDTTLAFVHTADVEPAGTLDFMLNLKENIAGQDDLAMQWFNASGQAVSDRRLLKVVKNLAGNYQNVVINLNNFLFSGPARSLRISYHINRGNTGKVHAGFFIDLVKMDKGQEQGEDTPPPVGITEHNRLEGIQGGNEEERWHLDGDQHGAVAEANAPSAANPFATISDLGGGDFELVPGPGLSLNGEGNLQLGDGQNVIFNPLGEFRVHFDEGNRQYRHNTGVINGNLLYQMLLIDPNTVYDADQYLFNTGTLVRNRTRLRRANGFGESFVDEEVNSLSANNDMYVRHRSSVDSTTRQARNYMRADETGSQAFMETTRGTVTRYRLELGTLTGDQQSIFTDTFNQRGIEYAGDYEANFLPRTLVTKQFVDAAIAAIDTGGGGGGENITAGPGLSLDAGEMKLGDDEHVYYQDGEGHFGTTFHDPDWNKVSSASHGFYWAGQLHILKSDRHNHSNELYLEVDYSNAIRTDGRVDWGSRASMQHFQGNNNGGYSAVTGYVFPGTGRTETTLMSTRDFDLWNGGTQSIIKTLADHRFSSISLMVDKENGGFSTYGSISLIIQAGTGKSGSHGSWARFTDSINQRGIEYTGDYEPNFVPRSLVTKQYVDAAVAAGGGGGGGDFELVPGQGLSLNVVGNLQLGDVSGNLRHVDVGTEDFFLSQSWEDYSFSMSENNINLRNQSGSLTITPTLIQLYHNSLGSLAIDTAYLSLYIEKDYNRVYELQCKVQGTGTKAEFFDRLHDKGLEYGGDYEANFTARSLVTKQYVDDAVTGAGGGGGGNISAGPGLSLNSDVMRLGDDVNVFYDPESTTTPSLRVEFEIDQPDFYRFTEHSAFLSSVNSSPYVNAMTHSRSEWHDITHTHSVGSTLSAASFWQSLVYQSVTNEHRRGTNTIQHLAGNVGPASYYRTRANKPGTSTLFFGTEIKYESRDNFAELLLQVHNGSTTQRSRIEMKDHETSASDRYIRVVDRSQRGLSYPLNNTYYLNQSLHHIPDRRGVNEMITGRLNTHPAFPGFSTLEQDYGYTPEEIDQIVRVITIEEDQLSGNGTIEEQIAEYLNTVTLTIDPTTSKINIEVIRQEPEEQEFSRLDVDPLPFKLA